MKKLWSKFKLLMIFLYMFNNKTTKRRQECLLTIKGGIPRSYWIVFSIKFNFDLPVAQVNFFPWAAFSVGHHSFIILTVIHHFIEHLKHCHFIIKVFFTGALNNRIATFVVGTLQRLSISFCYALYVPSFIWKMPHSISNNYSVKWRALGQSFLLPAKKNIPYQMEKIPFIFLKLIARFAE